VTTFDETPHQSLLYEQQKKVLQKFEDPEPIFLPRIFLSSPAHCLAIRTAGHTSRR
jgi:hypothetical protein